MEVGICVYVWWGVLCVYVSRCHLLESPHLVRAQGRQMVGLGMPAVGEQLYAGSSTTRPIASHNHGTPRASCLWCGASTGNAAGSKGINEVDG